MKMEFRIGDRVQLHPATDAWMKGDRYGEVEDKRTCDGRSLYFVRLDVSGCRLAFDSDDLLGVEDYYGRGWGARLVGVKQRLFPAEAKEERAATRKQMAYTMLWINVVAMFLAGLMYLIWG